MAKNENNWLTKKYQLIIRNEADFLEKKTVSYNYAKAIMIFGLAFTVNAVLGYFMIRYVDKLLSNKKDVKELGQEVVRLAQEKEELQKKVENVLRYEQKIKEMMILVEDSSLTNK